MKTNISNKETCYSLNNIENYKKELDCEVNDVTKKYTELIVEYYKFILENIKITNISLSKFIIIRGLDTITNVFLNILYFTKNLDLTYYHCQKSFYFYVEFVGQISDDEKMFLQLTSRDATTYVYKKTVFEINNELKKNDKPSDIFKEKMKSIEIYIHINQTYLLKIINSKKIDISNLEYLLNLCEKINNIQNKTKLNNMLETIIEKIYYMIEDIDLFFKINLLFIKRFGKNPETITNVEKKFFTDEINIKINEPPNKFINWLFSL